MDWPLLEVAIEPRPPLTHAQLADAAKRTRAADTALRALTDDDSTVLFLAGSSEEQLEAWITRLRSTAGGAFEIGALQITYREKLGRAATIDYTHKKQTGWSGEFARVKIAFEPAEPHAGLVFENRITDGAVPHDFVPGIESVLRDAAQNGLIAGFPSDVTARLIGGAYHDLDSSETAFRIAALRAFRELKVEGAPRLLHPVMKVEVKSPAEYVGVIIRDLNARRAVIQGQHDERNDAAIITATAPLANLLGYANTLRALSERRASSVMTFSHYEEVTPPTDGPGFRPATALRA